MTSSETGASTVQGSRLWAFVPAALLTAMVGGLLTMAIIAEDDPGFALERDYYEKAVNYDAEIAQRAENARLGFRLSAAITGDHHSQKTQTLVANVAGPSAPVTGARVSVQAIRNASASRVFEAELTESASSPGEYRGELPLERGGLWEFRFTVTQGDARYTESLRLDVPDTPSPRGGQP